MNEKIIHMKRVKCSRESSSASSFSTLNKQDSILRRTSHKKQLSVRFLDQAPVKSLKTLSQDLDRISSAIDKVFLFKEHEVKKIPLSSQVLKDVWEIKNARCEGINDTGTVSVPQFSGRSKQQNISWIKQNSSYSVKTFENSNPSSFFQKIQKDPKYSSFQMNPEDHKLDLKVVKKKITPSNPCNYPSFQMGIGHSRKPITKQTTSQGLSPKVVKSSGYLKKHSILKSRK
jgi:hypothetical protein